MRRIRKLTNCVLAVSSEASAMRFLATKATETLSQA